MSSSDSLQFAGDLNVSKAVIVNTGGNSLDITPQIGGVEIFESIFYPFITAKIHIEDNIDIINTAPLTGEELIHISATTPTMEDKSKALEFVFHAYKASDKVKSGDRSYLFTIHCISLEATVNTTRKISKAFNGSISTVVSSLVGKEGLKSSKKLVLEETGNKTSYVSNYWSPIKNIKFLTQHAVSKDDSPSYVFFENRDGFNFVSLETLYQGKEIQKFTKDNVVRGGKDSPNINSNYSSIIDVEWGSFFDYYKNADKGVYGSTLHTYDIALKRYLRTEFNPEKVKGLKTLNEIKPFNATYAAPGTLHMDRIAEYKVIGNMDDVTNNKSVQKRMFINNLATYHSIYISVRGRSDYTVGKTVHVNLPVSSQINNSDTPESTKDAKVSGKFLIAEINHTFNGKEYMAHLTLIKDSVDIT